MVGLTGSSPPPIHECRRAGVSLVHLAFQGIRKAFRLGHLMSDWKDRLHGEEKLHGIAPGTGIISGYACRDRMVVVDSSKGTLARHESSRHDAVCGSGKGS
jgi:hypothetical protein